MRIKLATPLLGEFPRYANVKLPDNAGVTAQNMRLDSGVLKPLNGYTTGATFKGAINYAVNKICTAYPNIKILFVSPIWRSRYNSGDGNDSDVYANSRGNYLLDFVDAMKEMSALNKMPCVDMYRTSGINKYNGATLLSDGLHPVAGVGYQRIAEKIAAGLVANW